VTDTIVNQVVLSYPTDGHETTAINILVGWTAVSDSVGVDSYAIEVAKNLTFVNMVFTDTLDQLLTSDTITGLYNDTYYWRVRAIDDLVAGGVVPDKVRFGKDGARWLHTGGIFAALSETTPFVAKEAMLAAQTIAKYAGFIVLDSAGRRVAGAVVRAIGIHRQVLTGADGSFRFDSMPPGGVSIVAHTDGYDSFAMLAASRRVDLQAGRVQRADLRAPNAAAMRREVCPQASASFGQRRSVRGVLRMLMVDSATTVPLPGVRFIASWPATAEAADADSAQERYRLAVTDSRGAATFCDLPTGFPVEVSVLSAGGGRTHVMMAEVTRNGILGRVVFGRINR